jgi:hypothetical protein
VGCISAHVNFSPLPSNRLGGRPAANFTGLNLGVHKQAPFFQIGRNSK